MHSTYRKELGRRPQTEVHLEKGHTPQSYELVETEFLPLYVSLASDEIVHVRIAVAKSISQYFLVNETYSNNASILRIKEMLSQDPVKDVQDCFSPLST